jgi:Flp pilus assembly protein TadG
MRLTLGRPKRERARQRGAAAIEFALSLVLLIPLIFGILDYGYYFYVAVSTVEATRVAARQIAAQSIGSAAGACTSAAATSAITLVTTPATSAAVVYMNQAGMWQGPNTTVTVTCGTAPVTPTWNVKVQVDFRPLVGFLRAGMHRSIKTAGYVEFSQSLFVAGT